MLVLTFDASGVEEHYYYCILCFKPQEGRQKVSNFASNGFEYLQIFNIDRSLSGL